MKRLNFNVQEYEKETTETVRRLFQDVEELFYSPKPSKTRQGKTNNFTAQERECHLWRENFPCLRVVGKAIPREKPKKGHGASGLSVTGKQSQVLRRGANTQKSRQR